MVIMKVERYFTNIFMSTLRLIFVELNILYKKKNCIFSYFVVIQKYK